MADGTAKISANTRERREVSDLDDAVDSFRESLAGANRGGVQVYTYDDTKKKYLFSSKLEIDLDRPAEFMDVVRYDFPSGGALMFRLTDQDGKFITNGTLYLDLASLPRRELDRLAREQRDAAVDRPARVPAKVDQGDDVWRQRYEDQQAKTKAQADTWGAIVGGLVKIAVISAPVAIPLLLKGRGGGDLEKFKAMMDLQKAMLPPPAPAQGLKETLEIIELAKGLVANAPEGDGGFFGQIAQGLGPMITQMMAAQAATPPVAPGANVVTPQVSNQPAAPGQARPGPGPAVPETPVEMLQRAQMQFIAKFTPIMERVRKLIEKEYGAEHLLMVLNMAIDTGEVTEDDAQLLYNSYAQNKENIASILALFGITDPDHVAIVEDTLALFGKELADNDKIDGGTGDASSPGDDGGPGANGD